MNRREFLTLGACAAAAKCLGDPVPEVDLTGLSADDFRKAVATIEATTMDDVEARCDALAVIQKYIYAMKTSEPYENFLTAGLTLSAEEVRAVHEKYPVLWWYDRAFDKVVSELRTTEVTGDVPAIWYLYNMGIVVKTKTCKFAIDLCHRRACELVPDLDFALVTHNHGDHHSPGFITKMRAEKKMVCTNFELQWNGYVAEDKTIERDGVKIHVTRVDHNVCLPKAVNCYEVECGGEKPFVIFHSGDAHRAKQLKAANANPDLFFGHCAIGFDFVEAYYTTMRAKKMVTLHHQELGHLGGRWRCVGYHEEPTKIRQKFEALGVPCAMPVWGDRIV